MSDRNSFFCVLQALRFDRSGMSMVEFALVLPVLLILGLYGTEIARLATTRMQVSQIALSLADNASRLGQTDNAGVVPTIQENQIDAILSGALRQGSGIDLQPNGRIILSSLEFDETEDRQFIHWQRCVGELDEESSYGDESENNGLTGARLNGMGKGSTKITALPNTAVMYVEVIYKYEPLFENPYGSGERYFREEAGFLIRDSRNLGESDEKGLTGSEKNLC